MNVNDVPKVKEYPDDLLGAIFAKQQDVMAKYHEIEKKNGLLQTEVFPFNLHDRFCQARIKDFLWRTTEELAESLEVLLYDTGEFEDNHIVEELIDALHFHTENCISCGVTPKMLLIGQETLDDLETFLTSDMLMDADDPTTQQYKLFINTITELGLAGNCLKNKPWKQDQKLTDITKFHEKMIMAYHNLLILLWVGFDMTSEDIFDMYFRKNEVNKFRQKSNY